MPLGPLDPGSQNAGICPTSQQTPLSDTDRISALQLIRSRRVGPSTYMRLCREYGSLETAIDALPDIARAAGVKSYKPCPREAALREFTQGRALGADLIVRGDPRYPKILRDVPEAPPVFWALGDLDLLARRCVALVGARNASSLGLRMTRALAAELGAAGICIVSGLARGIDAAAHFACLESGTIAVQAGGLDVTYPQENAKLQHRIGEMGLRVSEHPFGLQPQARHFPQRNRIIAALSLATVVIEGASRSGSLITARDAADMGRDVMAVPGNPLDGRAAGCNQLIRDGATLVRSGADVIEALADAAPDDALAPDTKARHASPAAPASPPATDEISARILQVLGPVAIAEDALIRDVGAPPQIVSAQLVALELDGRIERQPGGQIALSG